MGSRRRRRRPDRPGRERSRCRRRGTGRRGSWRGPRSRGCRGCRGPVGGAIPGRQRKLAAQAAVRTVLADHRLDAHADDRFRRNEESAGNDGDPLGVDRRRGEGLSLRVAQGEHPVDGHGRRREVLRGADGAEVDAEAVGADGAVLSPVVRDRPEALRRLVPGQAREAPDPRPFELEVSRKDGASHVGEPGDEGLRGSGAGCGGGEEACEDGEGGEVGRNARESAASHRKRRG